MTTEPWRREHLCSTSGSRPNPACPALPDQGSQTTTGRRTRRVKCTRSSPKAHRAPASEAQQVLGGAHSSRGDGATWPPRGGRLHPPTPLRGVHGSSPLQTSLPSRHSAGSRCSPARGPGGGRAERGPQRAGTRTQAPASPQDPSTSLKPGRPDPSHPDLQAAQAGGLEATSRKEKDARRRVRWRRFRTSAGSAWDFSRVTGEHGP